jgi:hypothetical protein
VMPDVKCGKPLAASRPPKKLNTTACHMRATPLLSLGLLSLGGLPPERRQQHRVDEMLDEVVV